MYVYHLIPAEGGASYRARGVGAGGAGGATAPPIFRCFV